MTRHRAVERADREAVLERQRALKMAKSAHAYVRGNTLKFYEWLDGLPRGTLPEGPPIWICGDCHLGNLGPLADADGEVAIQIRDLDQTVIGNPSHDLVRLGLSLASAARGSNLPGVVTARMLEEMVRGYGDGLKSRDGARDGDGEPPEPDAVRTIRHRALGRRWKHLARERLEDEDLKIPRGRRFWALDDDEHEALDALFHEDAVRELVLAIDGRHAGEARVRLLDAAYWMKGCSSLGFLRYAALLRIDERGEKPRLALVDLKEAVAAAAPQAPKAKMPKDPAERVVAGARALSPHLGERMLPARILGKPVVVRELLPQDLKLDVDQFSRGEAVRAARYLAHVVGAAHGRQMKRSARAAWRRAVTRGASADGAPSWLWSSVVELAGRHEVGYLEHCRSYADAEAA
ncbi:uncharacterized protein (DUF2252 family) [Methylorubrum rhodinum]|uniref:Uncharacterized protein (DUF2252 family) n=1 Tax=Methylorubrum rhodinum TaxID=29428 RepID=A0A840ZJD4_9HYPH|nr:DUF2252 family protein [Methylorubrum rhodinum]MBB5757248.1 uncharacterized protein (DUF2252 family) [Methylorubrum rhodinum]